MKETVIAGVQIAIEPNNVKEYRKGSKVAQ